MKNTKLQKKYPNLVLKVNDMIDLGYKSAKISRELNIKYVIILEYKNFYNHLKIYSKNYNYFEHGKKEPYFEDENLYGSAGKMNFQILTE
jgi:hypothetical protein